MACRGDYQGTWFTVSALPWYFPEIASTSELLIVDNDPASADGKRIARLAKSSSSDWAAVKYVPYSQVDGTAQPRNQVFEHASAPYVLCMDPHVLLRPGTLEWLLAWYADHPDSRDLLVGPCYGSHGVQGTDQTPVWSGSCPAYGRWHKDRRALDPDHPPFPVAQQGLGCFSMRREAWPGFHPLLRGWGGCETGLCDRVRQRGGRVLCCPRLRWKHFFAPGGSGYQIRLVDRFRNYLIEAMALGDASSVTVAEILQAFAPKVEEQVVRIKITEAEALAVIHELDELQRTGRLAPEIHAEAA